MDFADRLQELCESFPTLGGATVCGLLMMQVRMIQDAAKERQQSQQVIVIPAGWRELEVGEQMSLGDKCWWADGWDDIPSGAICLSYDRVRHSTVIRKVS